MNHNALNVIQDKRLVGQLGVEDGCWQFTYDDIWLRAEIYAPSLSPTLAKRKQPFVDTAQDKPVQDFFENMLPDGSMRTLMSEVRGHSDSFSLLLSMGHDLPGSLSLELKEKKRVDDPDVCRLSVGAFPNMLDFQALVGKSGVAPGGQMKLSADAYGTVLTTLNSSRASRVIIKAGSVGQPEGDNRQVLNEWYCTRLAKAIGFDTNYFQVSRLFGGSMIIRRFDRMRKGTKIDRLPVINGCQALGVAQQGSSEHLTAPSLNKLAQLTSQPNKTLRRLFAWVCYNAMIGNSDIELNDLSFSMSVDESRAMMLSLLPVYDLSSNLDEPGKPAKAAVFRGRDLKSITFDDILDIADDMNYNTETAHVDFESILLSAKDALKTMGAELEKEVNLLPRYEGIHLGEPECAYLRSVGSSIEKQIDRLVA